MRRRGGMPLYWLCGIALATLQFVFLFRYTYVHFALSDDIELSRTLMGYWGGSPASFCPYVHTVFAWPLRWLGGAFPAVPWFSVLQVTLLWFASALNTKALMQLCARLGRPAWLGVPLSVLFCAAFTLEGSTTITFSVTAAILYASAIFQVFAVDLTVPRGRARGLLLSLLPLMLGYFLRQVPALPASAFWLAALAGRLLLLQPRHRIEPLKAAVRVCAIGILCFGALIGIREADIDLQGQRAFTRWQAARSRLIDYSDTSAFTSAQLSAVGWTPTELAMFRDWYFWDENMGTSQLETLHALYAATPERDATDIPHQIWRTLLRMDARSPAFSAWWKAALLLGLLAFAGRWAARDRRLFAYAVPAGAIALAGLMLCYLAFNGRLPERAAAVVLFPALAALLCLALEAWPHHRGARVLLPAAVALLCAAVAFGAARTAFRFYYNPSVNFPTEINADARYANEHPDQLFFVDGSVPTPTALFTPAVHTANLVPLNHWNSRTIGKLATLSAFGLDGEHFSITALLRGDVRLLTGDSAPSDTLLAYLAERAGAPVYAVQTDQIDGLRVFRFTLEPTATLP